ncbi:MAG: FKBP-type peptidyl-prolyl cis-trans isomerase [Cognaticolwellia sp.]
MVSLKQNFQPLASLVCALFVYIAPAQVFALPAYEKVTPLYNNGSITIYPKSRYPRSQVRDWCGSRQYTDRPAKLEVVYDGRHAKRDALFPQGFEKFVDTAARSVLNKHCSDFNPSKVELYFYRRGEFEYLDKMRFQLRNAKDGNVVARVAESMNSAHPSYKRRVAEQELGSCSGKPFCDLTGGIYLNAIYENNEALIISLDKKITDEMRSGNDVKGVQDFVAAISGKYSKDNSNVDVGLKNTSILKIMATKYMALYGESSAHNSAKGVCLQKDSVSITRKYTTDVIRFENSYGIDQGAVGGDTFSEVYTINKEFKQLCNRICAATGEGGSYIIELMKGSFKASLVFSGISQVLYNLDCNSPEVKQFERNLISLTERSLQRKPRASAPTKAKLTDAEQAQETKRLFMEAMKEQAQNEKQQLQQISRTPQTRSATRQAQATASRSGETSRMARIAAQPMIDEKVLYDLAGNLKAGKQFLTANRNKDGVVETRSGLQYRIIKSGSGRAPESSDQVTAHMRGTLINGHVYSDTYAKGQPLKLPVGQVIKGVSEGLQLVKVGGKIQLFIPPSLAYGNQAAGSNIPAGSTLITEIELIKIN